MKGIRLIGVDPAPSLAMARSTRPDQSILTCMQALRLRAKRMPRYRPTSCFLALAWDHHRLQRLVPVGHSVQWVYVGFSGPAHPPMALCILVAWGDNKSKESCGPVLWL